MRSLNLVMTAVLTLASSLGALAERTFVHPGVTHKLSDLDRMKYMVEAGIDPWVSSYQEMASDSKSSYGYTVRGDPSFTELGRDDGTNYGAWNSDIRAAYYNAIRWHITGDERHAEKAVEIFNAWTNLTSVTSGGTDSLSGGVGYIMIEAAEIIKSTYDGWADSEIDAFKDMLVYPGYSTTAEPSGNTTFYWMAYQGDPGRHGNQGLSGWRTVMAMGIFMDNEIMYDRALRHTKGLPHRSDDLAYPSGPRTRGALQSSTDYSDSYKTYSGSAVQDYGFNGVMTHYIWENGQCQESSRDQQHTAFGIGLLTSMAEMAWNQGEDLYSYESDRLLLGLEYNMRYNVSALRSYPDQSSAWEPTVESGEFIQRDDRTLRWHSKAISPDGRGDFPNNRPVFEIPVAHFYGRGLKTAEEVKWITRARDVAIEESGYEVAGWSNDAIGWGALTARRPEQCYGDPITGITSNRPTFAMHQFPGTLEAERYDYSPVNGEGRTFHDRSAGNSGGGFRSDGDVDIVACSEGGYAVTDMEDGEWISYTVNLAAADYHSIKIRYAGTAGGAIRFAFDGSDVTGDVNLPATGSATNWGTYTVAENINLRQGVQSMRVYVSGTSGAYELNNITLVQEGPEKFIIASGDVTASTYQAGSVHYPSNTIDGDLGTRWSAQGDPQWIRYDLGAEKNVFSLKIAWLNGASRRSSFHIETSNDDATWTALTETLQSSGATIQLETVVVTPTLARYVRIVGHGNSSSTWNSITDVEIWGVIPVPPPVPEGLAPTPGDGQVTLSWTGSAGATQHNLKRSITNDTGYATIASVAGSSHLDINVVNGTRYYYVVSAESAAGESINSTEVSAVPSAPLNKGDVVIGEVGIVSDGSAGQDFQVSVAESGLGHNYQVWTSGSLVDPDWQIASGVEPGNGSLLQIDVPLVPAETNLFYKLEAWRQ